MIMTDVLNFLNDLSRNNNREWFEANKKRYLAAKATMDAFALELIAAIRAFDDSIGPRWL